MTKLEIIEQLFDKGYCLDTSTRSSNDSGCLYITKDGRMCAIGKCLIDPTTVNTLLSVSAIPNLENKLKPEYRGHSVSFWAKLQRMHDNEEYWNNKGLAKKGTRQLNKLKLRYSE